MKKKIFITVQEFMLNNSELCISLKANKTRAIISSLSTILFIYVYSYMLSIFSTYVYYYTYKYYTM